MRRERKRLSFESLEHRRVLATLFVDASVPASGNIFAKINDAIAAAHAGDTIKVVGGNYAEDVVVDKPLTLIGGQVRVAGQSGASIVTPFSPNTTDFILTADNITLKNFTIKNGAQGVVTDHDHVGYNILHNTFLDDLVGISLATSSAATAKTTKISGNSFTTDLMGATPQESINSQGGLSNVTISDNLFVVRNAVPTIQITGADPSANVRIMNNSLNSSHGIAIASATKAKIVGNSIRNLASGATAIHLAGAVSASEVSGNTLVASTGSTAAEFGIHLDQSLVAAPDSGNKISANTLTTIQLSGGGGILGFAIGIFLESADHNAISGNSVSFASSEGIMLKSSDSNSISSNVVTQSGLGATSGGIGISLETSSSNTLFQNVANDNQGGGIVITGVGGSATGNILKQNTANFNYGSDASGFELTSATQSKLLGNQANYNTRDGFDFFSAADNVISGNSAARNLAGGFVLFPSSTGNMLSANAARGNLSNGFAVAGTTSTTNTFKKNTATNNIGAAFTINSGGNMLISNTASGNGGGIFIRGSGSLVQGNMVVNNIGAGLSFSQVQMATVSANIVKNNRGNGIQLNQVASSTISGNLVMNNDGDGIDLLVSATGNTISGNTAMGNGSALGGFDLFDASTGGGTAGTANTWAGNHALTRSPAGLL